MIKATHYFPAGFLWGTATAAHQVEGDNTNNDWSQWEQNPNRIVHGHKAGKACDWWGGRWKEDFDRARDGHQNAHRLSVEWSRIEPSPAVWDESALAQYRDMIRGLLDRGLMPMVTLHHFSTPLWVAEKGGWLNPDIVTWFDRFVRKVVGVLADLVGLWITINEPNVFAVLCYLRGAFPPGHTDLRETAAVVRNLVLAHAAAYHAVHELQPGGLVGMAHQYRSFIPANPGNPADRLATRVRGQLFNDLVASAATDGILRLPFARQRIRHAARTQDLIGVNYYTRESVAFDLTRRDHVFMRDFFPEGSDLSSTGFIASEPEGLWEALVWARRFGLPIYITENGVEDPEDRLRPRYIATHVRQVWRAANLAWKVRGYFYWTLVDNFEWERGWTQRFGLWELDVATQERRKRPSADLYAEICQANALSAEMVARFAPEALESIFPGRGPAELGLTYG